MNYAGLLHSKRMPSWRGSHRRPRAYSRTKSRSMNQVETYRYRPDVHLQEYECLENNRNGPHGEAGFNK
jgi:hypothetical protein